MRLETKWFWLSLYEKVQRKHYQDLCHNFYGNNSGFTDKLHNLWLGRTQTDTLSSLIQRWLQTGTLRLVYTLLVYFGLIWNMKPSDWHSYSGKPSTLHWITVSSHSQFFGQKCVRFVLTLVGIVLVSGISLQLEWKSVCRSCCCRLRLIRQHPSASQVIICLCMEPF